MPYIEPGKRAELLTEPQRVTTPGDWNYLYSVAILKVWNANPKYETIHKLKRATKWSNVLPEIQKITDGLLALGIEAEDTMVAAELAFAEFYARIGRAYEFHKMNTQGDLEGYTEALLHLNNLAREDFNSRIGFKENK